MTVPQAPVIATTITMSAQMFLKNPKNILLARAKAAIFYTTKERRKEKKKSRNGSTLELPY